MFVAFAGRIAALLTDSSHQLSLFPLFDSTYVYPQDSNCAFDSIIDHLFPVLHDGGFRPPVVELGFHSQRCLRLLSQPLVRQ
jgi:hypothetical protein